MTDPDPMLAALRAADEHARTACHAAYGSAPTLSDIYDRAGALHGLLSKVEQLARHLADDAAAIGSHPASLYSTDDTSPADHANAARDHLTTASMAIDVAVTDVNDAWSHLSPIGRRSSEER